MDPVTAIRLGVLALRVLQELQKDDSDVKSIVAEDSTGLLLNDLKGPLGLSGAEADNLLEIAQELDPEFIKDIINGIGEFVSEILKRD